MVLSGALSVLDFAILTSTSDSEGIEAFVVMFKEDMDKFNLNRKLALWIMLPPTLAYL